MTLTIEAAHAHQIRAAHQFDGDGCLCGHMPLGSTKSAHARHVVEISAAHRPCAGCQDPINHPHAFDCTAAAPTN